MSIQIEAFQLAPGVDAAHFIAADESYEQWSYAHRAGIARRTTARSGENWLIVTIWSHFSDSATPSEQESAWREMLDEATYRSKVYETL